jgi:hypothetical protein
LGSPEESEVDPRGFRVMLEARGVELGPPADNSTLAQYEARLGGAFDPYLREIYLEFNGYASHDSNSHLSLWPLERILANSKLSSTHKKPGYLAFGDFLMDSDFLMANFYNSNSPVFFLYENRVLASTIPLFLQELALGKFDLN